MALIYATEKEASALSRAVRAGALRRLARGLYTDELRADAAQLVRSRWNEVLAHYFPGALIADRSVPRAAPDEQGYLFVVHGRARPMALPGLTIVPRKGSAPLPDDIALGPRLWLSSPARALVENLRPSRAVKGRPRRTLTAAELHDWVARLRTSLGAEGLNRLRDRARQVAQELALTDELATLDDLIGAALGTRTVETSSSSLTAAMRGARFDERREALFSSLAQSLATRAPAPRTVLAVDLPRQRFLPFFEAYFSNFIEGTELTVAEARAIVLEGKATAVSPEDAHDVRGTFAVVADDADMRRRPQSPAELIALLQARHARVLGGRPDKRPGELKQRANRAGSTEFVAPELVVGTLSRGFELMERLEDPFARAVYMMFLIAEVHPFEDGNGRIARIMMNAELHAQGEQRIIVPTVYRTEYLAGLRAMTYNQNAGSLMRVLDFAQRYTAQIDFTDLDAARAQLTDTNAFVSSGEAADRGLRLVLPSAR